MKDIHVTVPALSTDSEEQVESLQQPTEGEDNVARWKRIAKLAVLRSASYRWSQVRILIRNSRDKTKSLYLRYKRWKHSR